MRKIIVLEFITLDGVIQAGGGPEEDTSGGFKYGGWAAPYDDELAHKAIEKLMRPADLLLGRRTFDIWEGYWPQHAEQWPGVSMRLRNTSCPQQEKNQIGKTRYSSKL